MVTSFEHDLLDELEESILEENIEYCYYVMYPRIFAYYKNEDLVIKTLRYLSDYQLSTGEVFYENTYFSPTYLLYALSSILYLENSKKIKSFKKTIKKIVANLEDNLDSHYLLFSSPNIEGFSIYDQVYFLRGCDEICALLNDVGMIKEADRLFMIKGKIELGFKRYLTKSFSFITNFSPKNFIFSEASEKETLEILALLKDEIPSEFEIFKFINNYTPKNLYDEVLFTNIVSFFKAKKQNLNNITTYFIKKGATNIISKTAYEEYKKTYKSLFREEPLVITSKKSKFYGINDTTRIPLLLHTLEGIYGRSK